MRAAPVVIMINAYMNAGTAQDPFFHSESLDYAPHFRSYIYEFAPNPYDGIK